MKRLESQAIPATSVAAAGTATIQKAAQKTVSFVRSDDILPGAGPSQLITAANPEEIQLDDDDEAEDDENEESQPENRKGRVGLFGCT